MKVIAASATQAYRATERDLRAIGRQLGVRYLLEGNVRRIGQDLRVTAQLVEAEEGDILWTQKFDRPLAEIGRVQEDLVSELAAHLGVQIERAEMEHVLTKSDDKSAREAIMRSDALSMGRPTSARAEAAVAEARRAVSLAPDYAAARAALAGTLSALLLHSRGLDDPAVEREILDNVAIARTLDPGNPLVLCRMAAALNAVGQEDEALLIAERALAINPNLDIVRATLASILLRLGRWEDALAECDAAEKIAPNGMWANALLHQRGSAYFQAGRFEEALTAAEESRRLFGLYPGQFLKVLCLAKLERWEEATAAMRHVRSTWPEMTVSFAETFVRRERMFGRSPEAAAAYAAIVRRLWDETGGAG
jgi:tetratricopeptide (TPR) repeat protein